MSTTTTTTTTSTNDQIQQTNAQHTATDSPPPGNTNDPYYIVTKYIIRFNTSHAGSPPAEHFNRDTIERFAESLASGQTGPRDPVGRSVETSRETANALAQEWIDAYRAEHPGCGYRAGGGGAQGDSWYVAVTEDGAERCEVIVEECRRKGESGS
ncbi:MAG: hypothetical protein Q9202_001281 [Teloschistes flavicans]